MPETKFFVRLTANNVKFNETNFVRRCNYLVCKIVKFSLNIKSIQIDCSITLELGPITCYVTSCGIRQKSSSQIPDKIYQR